MSRKRKSQNSAQLTWTFYTRYLPEVVTGVLQFHDDGRKAWWTWNGKRVPASVSTVMDFVLLRTCREHFVSVFLPDVLRGWLTPGADRRSVRTSPPLKAILQIRRAWKWVD